MIVRSYEIHSLLLQGFGVGQRAERQDINELLVYRQLNPWKSRESGPIGSNEAARFEALLRTIMIRAKHTMYGALLVQLGLLSLDQYAMRYVNIGPNRFQAPAEPVTFR